MGFGVEGLVFRTGAGDLQGFAVSGFRVRVWSCRVSRGKAGESSGF